MMVIQFLQIWKSWSVSEACRQYGGVVYLNRKEKGQQNSNLLR